MSPKLTTTVIPAKLLWLGGTEGFRWEQWAHRRQLLREGHPLSQWDSCQVCNSRRETQWIYYMVYCTKPSPWWSVNPTVHSALCPYLARPEDGRLDGIFWIKIFFQIFPTTDENNNSKSCNYKSQNIDPWTMLWVRLEVWRMTRVDVSLMVFSQPGQWVGGRLNK